jgi:hypothetical protein
MQEKEIHDPYSAMGPTIKKPRKRFKRIRETKEAGSKP